MPSFSCPCSLWPFSSPALEHPSPGSAASTQSSECWWARNRWEGSCRQQRRAGTRDTAWTNRGRDRLLIFNVHLHHIGSHLFCFLSLLSPDANTDTTFKKPRTDPSGAQTKSPTLATSHHNRNKDVYIFNHQIKCLIPPSLSPPLSHSTASFSRPVVKKIH